MQELELYAACPLCDSVDLADLRADSCVGHALYQPQLSPTVIWRTCQACGHIFRNGYYTDEACAVVFSATHEYQQVGYDLEGQRWISARMIEKVVPWRTGGPWLDLGFGNGALLLTAQEFGFEPVGVDLRADNVAALREFGLEAHCQPLETLGFPGRFSVISMADVLEHTPFPRLVLSHAHSMLDTGGVLFLSMPNADSPVWRLLDGAGANPYWGELEHYHNFGRARLQALLEEQGFTPVQFGVSERYRACMEVIALKRSA